MLHPVTSKPRAQTLEFGPQVGSFAPAFAAVDHAQQPRHLHQMMGEKGLLLAFVGSIWRASNVRRIVWLQRHARAFIAVGFNVALIATDKPYTLNGFYVSSPFPPQFPFLADVNSDVHRRFNMTHMAGLVLLNRAQVICEKWLVPDESVWPALRDLLAALETV